MRPPRFYNRRGQSLHEITRDRLFVPFDSGSGPLVEDGAAVHDGERLLDDGIEPFRVLEPVRGRRGAQKVRAYLDEEMIREADAVGFAERRRAEPAGDAADL